MRNYSPWGTMSVTDPRLIDRESDLRVRQNIDLFMEHGSGRMTSVMGSRQTGKSTTILCAMEYAREKYGEALQVVFVDCQTLQASMETSSAFMKAFAHAVARAAGWTSQEEIESFWQKSYLSAGQTLSDVFEEFGLKNPEARVLLVLDEVESIGHMEWSSDFFGLMRAWFNSASTDKRWQRISFILSSAIDAGGLIRNVNQSPFNIGDKVYLYDFTLVQTRELNHRYEPAPLSEAQVDELFERVEGHIFLTQFVMFLVAEGRYTFDEIMADLMNEEGLLRDHYELVVKPALYHPQYRAVLMAVLKDGLWRDEPDYDRVRSWGVIRKQGTGVTFRNALYTQFLTERLTAAPTRRSALWNLLPKRWRPND